MTDISDPAQAGGDGVGKRSPLILLEILDFSMKNGEKWYKAWTVLYNVKKIRYVKAGTLDNEYGLPMTRSFEFGVKAGEEHRKRFKVINQNVHWVNYKEKEHTQIFAIHDVEIEWDQNGKPIFKSFLLEWQEDPGKLVWIKEKCLKPDPKTGKGGCVETVKSFMQGFLKGYTPP